MKVLVLILTFIMSSYSFADEVGLLSVSQRSVTNGDLVRLKIIDTRLKDYYSKYKNKRVGTLIYVLDIIEKQDELYFDAIVSEMGPKEKKLELDDKFVLKGLNYYPSKKNQMMDFITLSIPVEIKKQKSLWLYLIFVIIALVGGLWWYSNRDMRRKTKKIKRIRQERNEKLLSLLKKAQKPDEYAEIYLKRHEIMDNFELDSAKFKKVIEKIDLIQYQEQWPQEELELVRKTFVSISDNIKVKSGV